MLDTFSERMEWVRTNRNLSRGALARASDIDKGTISKYANGIYLPNCENLYKLADALEVDAEWLWRGKITEYGKTTGLKK